MSKLPARRSVVWAYHIDANRRMHCQLDTTSVGNRAPFRGRTGVGMESHGDHGSYRLNHRIVDWQPLDYIAMDTVSVGKSTAKPPNGHVTFAMQHLQNGRRDVSIVEPRLAEKHEHADQGISQRCRQRSIQL